MNRFLANLLNNLWVLIGSALNFTLFLLWAIDQPEWEPSIGLIGSSFILIGSIYSYVFYQPNKIPKLELSHEGASGKLPPTPAQFRMSDKTHDMTIKWDYSFFIRNNSSYPAFKINLILRDEFAAMKFKNMDRYSPMLLLRFNEMYSQWVQVLNKDEPIKPLDKVAFEASYSKRIHGSRNDGIAVAKSFFPKELENMEILVEYENEDGDQFYTLFTRVNNSWANKRSKFKPWKYVKLGLIWKKTKN